MAQAKAAYYPHPKGGFFGRLVEWMSMKQAFIFSVILFIVGCSGGSQASDFPDGLNVEVYVSDDYKLRVDAYFSSGGYVIYQSSFSGTVKDHQGGTAKFNISDGGGNNLIDVDINGKLTGDDDMIITGGIKSAGPGTLNLLGFTEGQDEISRTLAKGSNVINESLTLHGVYSIEE